jgi:hypothetical protein
VRTEWKTKHRVNRSSLLEHPHNRRFRDKEALGLLESKIDDTESI